MSKLNLYQCLSVARPYYEDMFCLGLHVMSDTGQCVASEIGHPQPAPPPSEPVVASAASVQGGATASADGPIAVRSTRQ